MFLIIIKKVNNKFLLYHFSSRNTIKIERLTWYISHLRKWEIKGVKLSLQKDWHEWSKKKKKNFIEFEHHTENNLEAQQCCKVKRKEKALCKWMGNGEGDYQKEGCGSDQASAFSFPYTKWI